MGGGGLGFIHADAQFDISGLSGGLGLAEFPNQIEPALSGNSANWEINGGTHGGGFTTFETTVLSSGQEVGGALWAATATAQADKRTAGIESFLEADSTSAPTGDLRFYTANGGIATERFRLWPAGGLSNTGADPGASNLAISGRGGFDTISNGCSGIAALAAGSATVNNPCFSTTRPVICTEQNTSAPSTIGCAISGTTLTIKSISYPTR